MTATPPEGQAEEKEARSPGYHRVVPSGTLATADSSMYYGSDPGYSYYVHYEGNGANRDGYNGNQVVDYVNGYSSPRDSYGEEEYWPEQGCGGGYRDPWGGDGGSGLGGFSSTDLELPIVLGALALGGLATYFLRQAITTNIKGRRRRRQWSPQHGSEILERPAGSLLQFLWSGKKGVR